MNQAKFEKLVRRHEVFGRIWLSVFVAAGAVALHSNVNAPFEDFVTDVGEAPVRLGRMLRETGTCECKDGTTISTVSESGSVGQCGCDCKTQFWNGTSCQEAYQSPACTNFDTKLQTQLDVSHIWINGTHTPNSDGNCKCNRWHSSKWEWYELALRVAGVMYLFIGIAIVCDDFFEDSLVSLSREFKLSQDVAGATFMAAGSSAPELFTSMSAVMFDFTPECPGDTGHANVGVGTIVGSAIFNILVIIGATAMLAGGKSQLDWKPFLRDAGFYAGSIVLLWIVINDSAIMLWESCLLLGGYVSYIVWMRFNEPLLILICGSCSSNEDSEVKMQMPPGLELDPKALERQGGTKLDGGFVPAPKVGTLTTEDTQPLVSDEKPAKQVMEDEDDETRGCLDYWGCGCGDYEDTYDWMGIEDEGEKSCEFSIISGLLLGLPSLFGADGWACGRCKPVGCCKKMSDIGVVKIPVTLLTKLSMALSIPWYIVFKFTIPVCDGEDDSDEEGEDEDAEAAGGDEDKKLDAWKYWSWCCVGKYWVTFFVSVAWIGVICFGMVEFCVEIGKMLNVSTAVMGLTVLSAGTSVPDALASIGVAQKGRANQAVSNALGSNVFDVLLGLGLPYALKNIKSMLNGATIVECPLDGSTSANVVPVCMCTKDVELYVLCLFVVLILTLVMFGASKFMLEPGVGIWLMLLYAVFATGAIFRDQDVFGENWLGETCKDGAGH